MSYQTRSVKDQLLIDPDRLKAHIEKTGAYVLPNRSSLLST